MPLVPLDKDLEGLEHWEDSEVRLQDQQDSFQVKSSYILLEIGIEMLKKYKIQTNKVDHNRPQSFLNLNNNKINKFILFNLMYKIQMEE